MMKIPLCLYATLAHATLSAADWQYRSRPDLSPPKLNITLPATPAVAPGYLFVAPYSANREYKQDSSDKPEQAAAYIFRNDGDLIWSSVGYLAGFVANFQVTKFKGQDALLAFEGSIDLLHGHGFGHATILGHEYQFLGSVRGGNHRVLDLHEFSIVNGRTALVEVYEPVPWDLGEFGGNGTQKWIVDAVVQELDIETNDVLFEWRSLDHVSPRDSVVPLGHRPLEGFTSFDAWDYFHANSVDKDAEGNYLVSARHTSSIYKINGKTGAIIWTLGGRQSNFTFAEDNVFAFQHDARFRGKQDNIEYISLFDNGAGSNGHQGDDKNRIRDFSSGKLFRLNTSDWTATLVKNVVHPDRVLAASQGNTQILSNGNLFVNWGQAGTIAEFRTNDSTPIFSAYLDSWETGAGVQNYRGFRFEWTGRPREAPAIVALKSRGGVDVYVSWNGDTETAVWRFFYVGSGVVEVLGEVEKTGFETRLEAGEGAEVEDRARFFAEAVDAEGRVLGRTSVVGLGVDVKGGGEGNGKVFQVSGQVALDGR